MRVQLLGTGAADGWPTPMCSCASCAIAARRGDLRGQTAATIDDRILIDCGPEVPRAAVRAGTTLRGVSLLLLTHAHPDHCHPQLLLWRRWANVSEPLVVAGPADALAVCHDWVGPDDPVTWAPLSAGDELAHERYVVRALPATHTPGALLYDIEDADGTRVLYATDTGPLDDACLEAVTGRRYDGVLLELTWGDVTDHGTDHHDLASFAATIAELRRRESVVATTALHAIHLGHHNPPEPELGRRLAPLGASAPRDADIISLGLSHGPDADERPAPPRRTLVLGGARSGKSTEAERLVAADPSVVYVATAPLSLDDPEWAARIDEHRARRPVHWQTVETPDVCEVLRSSGAGTTVLVDCLTLWLTGVLDAHSAWDDRTALVGVRSRIDDLTDALRRTQARVVLVSNEVGSGVVPATASGRTFRDLLGVLNARTAAACEEVLLVTAGRVQHL